MPAFCITLPAATARQERFQRRAKQLGLSFQFFFGTPYDAVNGLTAGEVGCFHSHRALWEQAAQADEPTLIFEDDSYLYRAIQSKDLPPEGCELVFLNSRINAGPYPHHGNRFRNAVHGCGLEGYIVTPAGAAKLVTISQTVTKPIDLRVIAHCDTFNAANHPCCNAEFWEPTAPDVRIASLKLWPPIVAHMDYGHSTIHDGVAAA